MEDNHKIIVIGGARLELPKNARIMLAPHLMKKHLQFRRIDRLSYWQVFANGVGLGTCLLFAVVFVVIGHYGWAALNAIVAAVHTVMAIKTITKGGAA